jgi:hypothetical protein
VGLHSSPKAMLALHGGQWVIGKITPTEKGFELAQQFHQELILTSSFILFYFICIYIYFYWAGRVLKKGTHFCWCYHYKQKAELVAFEIVMF